MKALEVAAARPTNRQWSRGAILFIVFVVLYGIIFNSALFAEYGICNDYLVFQYQNTKCCVDFPETQHLFWVGRPLGALLLNVHFSFLTDVASFAWARLASLIIAAATAAYVVHSLEKIAPENRMTALAVGVLIFTLPSYLLYIQWLTNLVPGILAVALSAAAYSWIDRGVAGTPSRKAPIAVGLALLFASFLIYPPNAFFYLLFTCWRAAFAAADRRRLSRAAIDFVILGAMSGAYVLAAKLLVLPFMKAAFGLGRINRPRGTYAVNFASDIERTISVALEYVTAASNLWLMGWSGIFSLITAAAVVVAAVVSVHRWRSSIPERQREAVSCAVTLGAILVSAAPVVAASGGFVMFRSLFVTAALTVLLGSLLLRFVVGKKGLQAGVFAATLLCAVVAAEIRVNSAAENATRELAVVRGSLAAFNGDSTRIVVRQPPTGAQLVDIPQTLDFGNLTMNVRFNSAIVRLVLRERGFDPDGFDIVPLPWGKPELKGLTDNAFVADLTPYYPDALRLKPTLVRHVITPSTNSGCCSVTFAFDDHLPSFWETDSGYPVSLDIEYPESCAVLDAYSITIFEGMASRAPKLWQVIGVDRAGAAILLDRHVEDWASGLDRRVELPKVGCMKSVRFEFLEARDPKILRISEIRLYQAPEPDRD